MPKRTFQPSNRKERINMVLWSVCLSSGGKRVLSRRRAKGRSRLTVSDQIS